MKPRVTVVIATYDWSSVLPYSIGSVLGQSFADFELLVIGDGCTDDSEQVVRGIEDPRVRWINIPRHGHQSGPNNEGLRVARGELIAYLGHDDLWLPHHLEVLVPAVDAGADVAHSTLLLVGPDGAEACTSMKCPTSTLHRRAVTESIGGWRDYRELTVAPELELWSRASSAGMRFAFVPRLTAVKFPAAHRRNVYRERPCHEQATWLERIRTDPDLEMKVLVRNAVRPEQVPTVRQRLGRLIRQPWRVPGVLWRRLQPQAGLSIRITQRFKGVGN